MTQNLVKFPGGGLPASTDDLAKGLQNVSSNMGPNVGGTPFLRLGKDGIWIYGQEDIEVEEGSLWAINPYSMQHGWAAWGDGELLGEVMVPMTQTPPPRNELQDFGVDWRTQLGLILQCVSGDDTGQTVYYKSTSLGMQNAVRELNNDIMAQLQKDKVNIVPVVTLESDSYKHKDWGRVYTPVLEIDHWVSMESGETAEPDPEDALEAETAAESGAPEKSESDQSRRRRRGAEKAKAGAEPPAEEPAAEKEEKPRRRRRRGG